jgi:hypothetical protein
MWHRCARTARVFLVVGLILQGAPRAGATGVPVDGFLPFVGFTLTDEFDTETFFVEETFGTGGSYLRATGSSYFDLALLDTGAGVNLITAASDAAFGIDLDSPEGGNDGFRGTQEVTLGGATGFLQAVINDPLGLYASGLQGNPGGASLVMNGATMNGQTNTSLITVPAESSLPNIVGLPFASRYATQIRNDQPVIMQVAGQTVRTPSINFLPLGTGNLQGIARRAPLSLNPGASFANLPFYFPGFSGELDFHEDPFQATAVAGGLFLSVNGTNFANGVNNQLSNTQFFFDTGASVTVLSELTALNLGIDVVTDTPDFTISITGSAGVLESVPGYFMDQLTVQALGGNVTMQNVPVLILNVTNVADPGNIVPGIIGTNFFSGRNLVIDPDPSLGGGNLGPHVYISDPVTNAANWATGAASGTWTTGSNWSAGSPTTLSIANVRHVSGGNQTAIVNGAQTAWEVNVSGAGSSQQMTLLVAAGSKLTTFTGLNVEQHGQAIIDAGATLDVQFVDVRNGGRLSGAGSIVTGSGPITGQVENVSGIVAPGGSATGLGTLSIEGRFSNAAQGILEMELGGATFSQYDRLIVEGSAGLAGTLRVFLTGGYVPALGAQFTLLTTSDGIGGQFDATELPALAAGRMWFLGYGADALLLKVTLPGDFDGNGSVAAEDLAVWKAGLGSKYTGADFLQWQRFLGQSAAAINAAAVPEPSAALLALAACVSARMRRAKRPHSVAGAFRT